MISPAARVARNASYSLAGNVVASLAGTISSVVLARLLGPADFGIYALVLSAGGVMGMAVTLGVPHAVTKYVSEYEAREERETAGLILGRMGRFELLVAAAVAALGILFAPWLERVFDAPGFALAFRIAAAGLIPGAVGGVALAGLAGFQDYRRWTFVSIASTTFLFLTTVGLLVAGAGVTGAVGALAATGAFSGLLAWRALRHHVRPSLRAARLPSVSRSKLLRYVPPVGLVLLLDAVVWQRSEVFFLGLFRTPEEVAFYALAFGIATTVMRLLPRALSLVLAPVASGLYGAEDRVGMQVLFRAGSRYLAILAAPILVGGSLLAGPLLAAVYGKPYAPAAAALPLLLLGAAFGAVGSVTAAIQTGMERQDLVLRVAVVATAANLALDLALIPRWGVVGAAAANSVAQIGAVVAGIVLTAPLLRARFPVGECLRIFAAAGIVGTVAYLIATVVSGAGGLAAAVLAGAAVYPPALLLTRAVTGEDLERLRVAGQSLPARLRPGYIGALELAARCLP